MPQSSSCLFSVSAEETTHETADTHETGGAFVRQGTAISFRPGDPAWKASEMTPWAEGSTSHACTHLLFSLENFSTVPTISLCRLIR